MDQQAESISAREIYIDGDVNVENGDFVAGDKNILYKEAELRVVENWLQRFFRNANEYLATVFFRERNIKSYYEHILDNLNKLSVIGKNAPLDLENIYITLRVSEYRSRDIVPDDQKDEGLSRIPSNLAELYSKSYHIDQALNFGRKLVVLGDPGSGKSTLLKHLTLRLCKNDKDLLGFANVLSRKGGENSIIPIFATLNDFALSKKELIYFLESKLEENDFPYPGQFLREKLNHGKCFILLDGLDEVTDETTQGFVVEQINEMVKKYGDRNYFIVTSRIAGFRDQLDSTFIKLEVVEFAKKDIETFIANWFKDLPEKRSDLIIRLEKNKKMLALASNPLLLSIIAAVYEVGWKLPDRRVDLYEKCAIMLCEDWDKSKKILPRFSKYKDYWRPILEDLAYQFFTQDTPKVIFSRDDLLDVISQLLPEYGIESAAATKFLGEVMEQTGLLRQKSRTTYDFIHLTFQEYFVACAIKRKAETKLALSKSLMPQWHEVMLLLTGIVEDATTIIDQMLNAGTNDPQYFVLVARCFTDADRVDQSRRNIVIPWLFAQLLENESILHVRGIEDVLELFGDHEIQRLQKIIHQHPDDSEMLIRIANLFGLMGRPGPILQLINLLYNDNLEVVRSATMALAQIGDPAVDPLLESLDVPNPGARQLIAESLGEIGNPDALDALLDLIENDHDLYVRLTAITAVGKIGDPRSAQKLDYYLLNLHPKIRAATALALGQIGNPDVTLALMDTLRDVDPQVVRSAGIALRQLGFLAAKKIINTFSQMMNLDKEVEKIILALGYTGSHDAIATLKTTLLSNDHNIRMVTARAFGLNKETRVEDLEEHALIHTDPHIRASAVLALGYMGGRDLGGVRERDLLLLMARDMSPLVAISAAFANNVLIKDGTPILAGNLGYKLSDFKECYGFLPKTDSVHFLLDLSGSSNRNMRDHARQALVEYARYLNKLQIPETKDTDFTNIRVKGPLFKVNFADEMQEIYDYLIKNLTHKTREVSNTAAMALAQLDQKGKFNGLELLMGIMVGTTVRYYGVAEMRDTAVYGLMSRREVTLDFLLSNLGHKDRKVVELIALEFGDWSETSAAIPLLKLLKHYSVDVKIAALKSLGRISNVNTLPTLLGLVNEKLDHHVRIAWIDALSNFNDDRIPPLLAKFTRDSDKLVADTAKKTLEKIQKRIH